MARIAGLATVVSADVTISDDVVVTDALTVAGITRLNGQVTIGNATSDTIKFFSTSSAASQRASASQAAVTVSAVTAVATTAVTGTSPKGFATTAHGNAVVKRVSQLRTDMVAMGVLVNRMRADLVAYNLIKGAA